ncbi:GNAT family N-acetyltransferase [Chryseobacterium sp. M5A1_1a]
MNIEYRNLLPNESKAYRVIRLESLEKFPESFGANYQEALKTEKFRIESDIENQSLERFVFGAFAEQELIGICAFVRDENNMGNIYQMYVREGFQGKNIGFGLIQAIINEANSRFKGIEIVLEVTPKNDRAYHLYKKMGFQEVIDEKNTESNIVMKYLT